LIKLKLKLFGSNANILFENAMSTNVFEGNGVIVLIDEENIRNKRVYINEQGNRGEVLCNLSIKNKTLINRLGNIETEKGPKLLGNIE
jgi:predicted lactoylglutathione lyase